MTTYETLTFEQSGPVTRIVLNRPDAAHGTTTRWPLNWRTPRCDAMGRDQVVLLSAPDGSLRGRRLEGDAASPLGAGHFVKSIADDLHVRSRHSAMDAVLIVAVNAWRRGGVQPRDDRGSRAGRRVCVVHDATPRRVSPTQFVVLPSATRRCTPRPGTDLTNRRLSAPEAAGVGCSPKFVPGDGTVQPPPTRWR